MLGRRLVAFVKISQSVSFSSSAAKPVDEGKGRSFGRQALSAILIVLTGGVALSAIDDLTIYHGCSSKAMEKARKNKKIIDAIGEPIVKGPWYHATLAVAHKRNSVSCSFPLSGPQGSGILRLKAVRSEDDTWLSFFRRRNFDILILDAILHVPTNEETNQTIKTTLSDPSPAKNAASQTCNICPRSEKNNKAIE